MTQFRSPAMLVAATALVCLPLTACGSTAGASSAAGSSSSPSAGSTTTTAPPSTTTSSTVGGGAGTGGSSGRACNLLTTAETGAVVGQPVTAAEQDQGQAHACRYRPADPTGGRVTVVLFDSAASDFAAAATNQPVGGVPVSGLGEKAEFYPGEGLMLTYQSGHLLSVQVIHKGVKMGSRAEVEGLARTAAGRI